jgi:rhamnosyltransferase
MVKKLLSSQSFVIIVDNSEGVPVSQWINFKGCTIVPMGTNTGIAYAQNVGIRLAIKQKADVVVFFDQDSEIEDDFLSTLLYPLMPGKPGVVAPIYFDKARGYEFPAMKLNSFGTLSKVYRDNNSVSYPVDVVISSGMAVTKETFEVVGLMDEEFFIDFVDTEWCLRCRSKKVEILMVSAATMAHSIGDSSRNLGFMNIFVHSPIRSYYQIRNSFHFLKKKHVPLLLGLKEFLSLLLHHIIGLIFLKDRKAYLIQYFHAVRDGILGICGKKSELEIIK